MLTTRPVEHPRSRIRLACPVTNGCEWKKMTFRTGAPRELGMCQNREHIPILILFCVTFMFLSNGRNELWTLHLSQNTFTISKTDMVMGYSQWSSKLCTGECSKQDTAAKPYISWGYTYRSGEIWWNTWKSQVLPLVLVCTGDFSGQCFIAKSQPTALLCIAMLSKLPVV